MYDYDLQQCTIEPIPLNTPIMYQGIASPTNYQQREPINFVLFNLPIVLVFLFCLVAKLLKKPSPKIDHFTIQTDTKLHQLRLRIETLEKQAKNDPLNLNAKIDRLETILRSLETPAPFLPKKPDND
jgi:hypothetical protein